MNFSTLCDKTISCDCGREHQLGIREIHIASGALAELPLSLKKQGFARPFLVYDVNTYAIAGARVEGLLAAAGISFASYIFPDEALVPDEYAIGRLLVRYNPDRDLMIAVGSGTINDICRFSSYKLRQPYFVVGTAASMDGYASNVTPLIVGGMKLTYEAQVPSAIFGDLDILKSAPLPMLAAGVADILGKYSCLMDWKASRILTGEYCCPAVMEMVEKTIRDMVLALEHAENCAAETVEKVMTALVFSGIAMSYIGNSRPASGGEHQMSHYWEMQFLFDGRPALLHGTKVGIATVGMLHMYKRLLSYRPDFAAARERAAGFAMDEWALRIQNVYGSAAEQVISLEEVAGKNSAALVLARLAKMEENWGVLLEAVEKLPSSEAIVSLLAKIGAPWKPETVGVSDELVRNAVLYAKDLRNRFGLLQIIFDLGLGEEFADELVDFYHGM